MILTIQISIFVVLTTQNTSLKPLFYDIFCSLLIFTLMKYSLILSSLIIGMLGYSPQTQALSGSNLTLEDAYESRGSKWNGRPGLRRYSKDDSSAIYRKRNSSRALENPFRSRTRAQENSTEKKLKNNAAESIKDRVGKKKSRRISIRTEFNNEVEVPTNATSSERTFDTGVSLEQAYERSNKRRNLQPGVASLTRDRRTRNNYNSTERNSLRNQDRRRSSNNRSATTREKAERRPFLEQKFNRYRNSGEE